MNAITTRTRADGLTVELNLNSALPEVLDLLADAFDSDPELMAGLLVDLAQSRRELHRALEQVELGQVPDHVVSDRGARVDRLHEDLTEQLAEHITVELDYSQALALQKQLAEAVAGTFFGRLERAS